MKIGDLKIIQGDPDEYPAPSAAPATPKLDDAGELVKDTRLPANFPENAKPAGDGSFILTLDYPVTLAWQNSAGETKSEEYKSFHLKRLNGLRYKAVRDAMGTEAFRPAVLASMTDISIGRATLLEERMDPADFAAVLIVFGFFTNPGRRTGA